MPRAVSPKRFMMRSLSEPWLVPMRMARFSCLQRSTRGVKRSSMRFSSSAYCSSPYSLTAKRLLSAKLPGLMRTFSTCKAASMAASGMKWMSATMGTLQPTAQSPSRMALRLAACLGVGAVMRSSSQPSRTMARHWATVAAVSRVSVVHMLCTRIGWLPPMNLSPTGTARVTRR